MIEYLLKNAGSKDGAEDTSVDTTAFDYACACNMCKWQNVYFGIFYQEKNPSAMPRKLPGKFRRNTIPGKKYFKSYIIGAAGGSNIKEIAPLKLPISTWRIRTAQA